MTTCTSHRHASTIIKATLVAITVDRFGDVVNALPDGSGREALLDIRKHGSPEAICKETVRIAEAKPLQAWLEHAVESRTIVRDVGD